MSKVRSYPPGWKLEVGVAAAGLLAALAFAQPSNAAEGRLVSFPGPDGRVLNGVFVAGRAELAPAVVLVPMLGRPKDDWDTVAQRLADANISSLAIDLPAQNLPADPQELLRWQEDVAAAVGYLASRSEEVRPDAIGLAGASLGANLVVLAAAADPAIRSMALVSPSLDYRGVRIETPMREYGPRAALLIASVRDAYAARSVRELARNAPGPRQLRWSEVAAHGTTLLSQDPDLVASLVEWFQLTLG